LKETRGKNNWVNACRRWAKRKRLGGENTVGMGRKVADTGGEKGSSKVVELGGNAHGLTTYFEKRNLMWGGCKNRSIKRFRGGGPVKEVERGREKGEKRKGRDPWALERPLVVRRGGLTLKQSGGKVG